MSIVGILVIIAILFDWNWLRHPVERYISNKTQREFRISDLDVDLGWNPTIRVKDVYFANTDWGLARPMATIGQLEFSVSLRDLFDGKVYIPRIAVTDGDLLFELSKDDEKNWRLSEPGDKSPSKVRIGSLSVSNGQLQYLDHGEPLDVTIKASTFDPTVKEKVKTASAPAQNDKYTTRYEFKGKYHDAGFSGEALTGDVLSFNESNILFPVQGKVTAGTTTAEVEGTIADASHLSAIDVQLKISGQTLANLYPFLLLPLPASPPYSLSGHLKRTGNSYDMTNMVGKIGSTDVSGDAAYVSKAPRPLLTAHLKSKLLNVADLGPLVGVKTKESAAVQTPPTQAETATRGAAATNEKVKQGARVLPDGTYAGERLLPSGKFEGGRIRAIDAEVDMDVAQVKAPDFLGVDKLKVALSLHDGVMKLDPFDFNFAGGKIASKINLDARKDLLKSDVSVDVKRVRLSQLLPDNSTIAKSAGSVGAQIRLKGEGNSIADVAANADGSASAVIANGRISNLLDAASGLNGGKIISLFVGGDKEIPIRCGGLAFDVKDGIANSTMFIVDTEQTRIEGSGTVNLKDEKFNMNLVPKPKNPGILSLRTPVRVYGTFRDADFTLEKTPLLARAGGAIALAFINPLAALIPLIETGPGEDAQCEKVLNPSSTVAGGTTNAANKNAAPAPAAATPTKTPAKK